ncbi:MAG: hypothetical protein CMB99_01390 [Flavobacteriaceae bacterium]|nr:hypothetical protein [Flavobacteriaceae bacterium]
MVGYSSAPTTKVTAVGAVVASLGPTTVAVERAGCEFFQVPLELGHRDPVLGVDPVLLLEPDGERLAAGREHGGLGPSVLGANDALVLGLGAAGGRDSQPRSVLAGARRTRWEHHAFAGYHALAVLVLLGSLLGHVVAPIRNPSRYQA